MLAAETEHALRALATAHDARVRFTHARDGARSVGAAGAIARRARHFPFPSVERHCLHRRRHGQAQRREARGAHIQCGGELEHPVESRSAILAVHAKSPLVQPVLAAQRPRNVLLHARRYVVERRVPRAREELGGRRQWCRRRRTRRARWHVDTWQPARLHVIEFQRRRRLAAAAARLRLRCRHRRK